MYRILSLGLCLALAGCNDDNSLDGGNAVAEANSAWLTALSVNEPMVIESPSEPSLVDDTAPPIADEPMDDPEEPAPQEPIPDPSPVILPPAEQPPAEESPAEQPPAEESPTEEPPPVVEGQAAPYPLLFWTDMQTHFNEWQSSTSPSTQQFFRDHYTVGQVYRPFADRSLDWWGKDHAIEYEAATGSKSGWPDFADYEPFILKDADGRRLFFNFACDGAGTCSQYAEDIGDPDWQRLRIERMRPSVEAGYIGLWLDNINLTHPNGGFSVTDGRGNSITPIDPATGEPMTRLGYDRKWVEWLELIRAEWPDITIAHNSIWYISNQRTEEIRRQHLAADLINIERGFVDYGVKEGGGRYGFDSLLAYIDWVHGLGVKVIYDTKGPGGTGSQITEQEFLYAVATYWLAREPGDLLGIDDPSKIAPDAWRPELDVDLGQPLGPRYGSQPYRRDFECGSVTVWGPPERRGQITQIACE